MSAFLAPLGPKQLGVEVLVDLAQQRRSGVLTFLLQGQEQSLRFVTGRPVSGEFELGSAVDSRDELVEMLRGFAISQRGGCTFVPDDAPQASADPHGAAGPQPSPSPQAADGTPASGGSPASADSPSPASPPEDLTFAPIDTLGEAMLATLHDLGSSQLDAIVAARGLLPLQVSGSFARLMGAVTRCGGAAVPQPRPGQSLVRITSDVAPSALRSYVVLHLFGALRAEGHRPVRTPLAAVKGLSGSTDAPIWSATAAVEAAAFGDLGPTAAVSAASSAALAAPVPGTLAHEIHTTWARSAKLDHYAFLGVERDARPEQAQKAYFSHAKRWHSDRLAGEGLDAATRRLAELLFVRAEQAYKTLNDAAMRKHYDWELGRVAAGLPTDPAVIMEAEGNFLRGETLLRHGQAKAALEPLAAATRQNPGEPEFWAFHGFALYGAQGHVAREQAERLIRRGMALRESLDVAHEFLGCIAHSEGELEAAKAHLQQALQANPTSATAQRELRLVVGRLEAQGAAKKEAGGLRRLLKRPDR
jgi:curved DNA-binding protein CbpA